MTKENICSCGSKEFIYNYNGKIKQCKKCKKFTPRNHKPIGEQNDKNCEICKDFPEEYWCGNNTEPEKSHSKELTVGISGSPIPNISDEVLKEVLRENDFDESDYNWIVDLMKQAILLAQKQSEKTIRELSQGLMDAVSDTIKLDEQLSQQQTAFDKFIEELKERRYNCYECGCSCPDELIYELAQKYKISSGKGKEK